MTKEKRDLYVYLLQPFDIQKRKRISCSKMYVGFSTHIGKRLRTHLASKGANTTQRWMKKYGAVIPYCFVTGFTKKTYTLSFETAVQKHKLPFGERSKIPASIRRLIRVTNKRTWSAIKKIPNTRDLPNLTIHWIKPEFKPKPGEYKLNFPDNVNHVHKPSYLKLDNIIGDTSMERLIKKQAIQDSLGGATPLPTQ